MSFKDYVIYRRSADFYLSAQCHAHDLNMTIEELLPNLYNEWNYLLFVRFSLYKPQNTSNFKFLH